MTSIVMLYLYKLNKENNICSVSGISMSGLGAMFYILSSDEGRAALTDMLEVRPGDDPNLRENFKEIITGLCTIIRGAIQ